MPEPAAVQKADVITMKCRLLTLATIASLLAGCAGGGSGSVVPSPSSVSAAASEGRGTTDISGGVPYSADMYGSTLMSAERTAEKKKAEPTPAPAPWTGATPSPSVAGSKYFSATVGGVVKRYSVPLPGASVFLVATDFSVWYFAQTGPLGTFSIPSVRGGTYHVNVNGVWLPATNILYVHPTTTI